MYDVVFIFYTFFLHCISHQNSCSFWFVLDYSDLTHASSFLKIGICMDRLYVKNMSVSWNRFQECVLFCVALPIARPFWLSMKKQIPTISHIWRLSVSVVLRPTLSCTGFVARRVNLPQGQLWNVLNKYIQPDLWCYFHVHFTSKWLNLLPLGLNI